MTDILTQIGVYKRQEVASRRTRISLGELESAIRDASPPRGFKAALEAGAKGGRLALIAEIKKASPSKGLIRAEFDPPSLASAYALGGASCLSILTDGPSFQGAETHLVAARAAVALPVLRKDFLVDPWQVMESRSLGADAILVIMALVDDAVAKDLIAEGRRLQMDVLVEVHDEDEMARAAALGADLIGVNNRDLRSFRIDLGVTGRLAVHAPDHAMLVAESGIFTPLDAETLAAAGASAMLVGESLMRQEDVAQAVRALLGAGDERTRLIRLGRSSAAD